MPDTTLLPSGSEEGTPNTTPTLSRPVSPISGDPGALALRQNTQASSSETGDGSLSNKEAAGASSAARTTRASTTLGRSVLSQMLLSKPFKCPKPNCNKSYAQKNGLKYHMKHGSCNFAPSEDLKCVQELLTNKWSETATATGNEGEVTLSDVELKEVAKEASRKLRPFACGVNNCQKRYKTMKGLSESLVSHRGG